MMSLKYQIFRDNRMKFSEYIFLVFLLSACSISQAQNVVQPDSEIILTDYTAIEDQQDISIQELDFGLSPMSLYGNAYASIGSDNEIYLGNLGNSETTQISHDRLPKTEVVLSERYIVWLTQQGEITITASDGVDEQVLLYGIFVYDRLTGEQRLITQEPAPRMQLAIDGNRLVWADKRNELDENYTMYDVYGFDLDENKEYPIAIAPGSQQNPSIYANYVVWQDNRNSSQRDTPMAGCGNCPDNRFDIYLYDFETTNSRAIVENDWLKSNPVIYNHYVAWEGYSEDFRIGSTSGGVADLYLLDRETGVIHRVTKSESPESSPIFSQEHLLWIVRSDCDVVEIENDKEILPAVGVYSLDLNTQNIYQLASSKESFLLTDLKTLLLLESCGTEKAYTIFF